MTVSRYHITLDNFDGEWTATARDKDYGAMAEYRGRAKTLPEAISELQRSIRVSADRYEEDSKRVLESYDDLYDMVDDLRLSLVPEKPLQLPAGAVLETSRSPDSQE